MVKKKTNDGPNKGKGKIAKLKLNKETVKDLGHADAAQVKGGRAAGTNVPECSEGCRKN